MAGVETTKRRQVRQESDGKRVGRGWKVGRVSNVGWRRVGAVGLGHMARQDFARGMHRHVALSRVPVTGHCYWIPSQGTVSGHRLRARQEFARGRSRWCGGAGAWHITARHRMDMALQHRDMGIIVKLSEALPCVKSHASRTSGTIYAVM